MPLATLSFFWGEREQIGKMQKNAFFLCEMTAFRDSYGRNDQIDPTE